MTQVFLVLEFNFQMQTSHAMCCPLRLLVGARFQVYFTALTGLLFTFPSRYLFTIGDVEYLVLPE